MPRVELTRHLYTFIPTLDGRDPIVPGRTAAELVQEVEKIAPGFAFYVCDERGRLRQHVNVYVDGRPVKDRGTLTDAVEDGARVLILQALSGG
jgi:molybdopterin synthase sulfur carrier subunit